jgi:hypothetical protein
MEERMRFYCNTIQGNLTQINHLVVFSNKNQGHSHNLFMKFPRFDLRRQIDPYTHLKGCGENIGLRMLML